MIRGFIAKGGKELDVDIRNQEDKTPLMIAVAHGRQTIVGILLAHGADINACIRVKSPGCFVGTTALRIAAENGDIKMVEFLLKMKRVLQKMRTCLLYTSPSPRD